MISNLPLVRRSHRVLPWSGEVLKLEINIPLQRIRARRKGGGGLINEGGIISSEYVTSLNFFHSPLPYC